MKGLAQWLCPKTCDSKVCNFADIFAIRLTNGSKFDKSSFCYEIVIFKVVVTFTIKKVLKYLKTFFGAINKFIDLASETGEQRI